MFKKLSLWYKRQTPTTKGFIWVGLLLVVGIIIRWSYIVEHVARGFEFFNTK